MKTLYRDPVKCVFASALKQGLAMEPWLAWNLLFKPEKNLQSYGCFCLSSALIKGMIPHLATKYFWTHMTGVSMAGSYTLCIKENRKYNPEEEKSWTNKFRFEEVMFGSEKLQVRTSYEKRIILYEKQNKTCMVAHACNPNTWETEAEGLPRVPSEPRGFQASLGYSVRQYTKTFFKKEKGWGCQESSAG